MFYLKKLVKTLAIIFLMTWAGSISGQSEYPGTPQEIVEIDGISIPVYDFDGFAPALEAQDTTTYVINFWATWCRPCVEEMPHFLKLAGEMEGQQVEFLFVSLDFRKSLEKNVIHFVREHGMENRTVMLNDPDANRWISQVDPSWSGAIPATLVYKGDNREFREAQLTYEELKDIIHSFLNL